MAILPGSTLGMLGGGQLGRMLAVAGARLGLKTHIYADKPGPACDVAAATTTSMTTATTTTTAATLGRLLLLVIPGIGAVGDPFRSSKTHSDGHAAVLVYR